MKMAERFVGASGEMESVRNHDRLAENVQLAFLF